MKIVKRKLGGQFYVDTSVIIGKDIDDFHVFDHIQTHNDRAMLERQIITYIIADIENIVLI
jgi:hypothetical protein